MNKTLDPAGLQNYFSHHQVFKNMVGEVVETLSEYASPFLRNFIVGVDLHEKTFTVIYRLPIFETLPEGVQPEDYIQKYELKSETFDVDYLLMAPEDLDFEDRFRHPEFYGGEVVKTPPSVA